MNVWASLWCGVVWCHCGLWDLVGPPNIKVTIHILEVLHFSFSFAIKEHHQGDKDLVKDISVNDMRR